MATPALSAIHPPAGKRHRQYITTTTNDRLVIVMIVKVGGRRLSVSSKPRHAAPAEPTRADPSPPAAADYPRPVHAEGAEDHPPPHHDDEVPPKKEKKHMNHDAEKHMRDLAQRKLDATRPSKDMMGGQKGFGAAGRIAQPAGKSLGF
ncbi:hypothetical protein H0H87_010353 [Tephrocybe sp. NHM501043]|nr:hypothetical protein H0H87_010353 [Tephrocybe sp. NHM501043]